MKVAFIFGAALLLLDASSSVLAIGAGPYTSRTELVEHARKGDQEARWELAWGYSQEGKFQKGYDWIKDSATVAGDDDRAYLRAWLARQLGNISLSNAHIERDSCTSERCMTLMAGNFSASGLDVDAAKAYVLLWDKYKNATTFVAACSSLIAIRDWAAFDELITRVDWANEPDMKQSIPAILSLRKIRANYSGH